MLLGWSSSRLLALVTPAGDDADLAAVLDVFVGRLDLQDALDVVGVVERREQCHRLAGGFVDVDEPALDLVVGKRVRVRHGSQLERRPGKDSQVRFTSVSWMGSASCLRGGVSLRASCRGSPTPSPVMATHDTTAEDPASLPEPTHDRATFSMSGTAIPMTRTQSSTRCSHRRLAGVRL